MKNTVTALLLAALLVPAASAQKTTATPAKPVVCAQVLKTKVNLNKATAAELGCLKGVKPATAKDIIMNRPFKDAAEFSKKIEDIGKKLYELNKAHVTF